MSKKYFIGYRKGSLDKLNIKRLKEGDNLICNDINIIHLPISKKIAVMAKKGTLDVENTTKFLNKETFEFNGSTSDFRIIPTNKGKK